MLTLANRHVGERFKFTGAHFDGSDGLFDERFGFGVAAQGEIGIDRGGCWEQQQIRSLADLPRSLQTSEVERFEIRVTGSDSIRIPILRNLPLRTRSNDCLSQPLLRPIAHRAIGEKL
jgi:hypothetical protein